MKFGSDDSDEALAAHAKTGDRDAFEALVKRNKGAVYNFIRRYVGQTDDAYDILQNSFIAAWANLSRYDSTRPFLPWLRVIALNKCRDFGRRQSVRRMFLKTFAALAPAQDMGQADEGDYEPAQATRLANLDKAIADLPPFYKEPLLLTVVSGLSHQEAAKILGTTPKAIEMRLYRARQKILQAMGGSEATG